MVKLSQILNYLPFLVALVFLCLSIKTMLYMEPGILPIWYSVLFNTVLLLSFSYGVGYFISRSVKGKIHRLTIAAYIVAGVCIPFYFIEHKETFTIVVPKNYTGEIKLFQSTLNKDQISVNEYGIGYLTKKTFKEGFMPVVIQDGKDISKKCTDLVEGSMSFAGTNGTTLGPYSYVGFTIPGNDDKPEEDILELFKLKIIDTAIIAD